MLFQAGEKPHMYVHFIAMASSACRGIAVFSTQIRHGFCLCQVVCDYFSKTNHFHFHVIFFKTLFQHGAAVGTCCYQSCHFELIQLTFLDIKDF
mgnify:CR=1 FL=1